MSVTYLYEIGNVVACIVLVFLIAHISTFRTRTKIVYTINLVLFYIHAFLLNDYFSCWAIILASLHSLAHDWYPFIGINGLDDKYSGFVDVSLHTCLHLFVWYYAFNDMEWTFTHIFFAYIAIGSFINMYEGYIHRVSHPYFVISSIYQAMSSGLWVGFLLLHNTTWSLDCLLFLFIGIGTLNWILFKYSETALKIMFEKSYFTMFFVVPVWIDMCHRYTIMNGL